MTIVGAFHLGDEKFYFTPPPPFKKKQKIVLKLTLDIFIFITFLQFQAGKLTSTGDTVEICLKPPDKRVSFFLVCFKLKL